MALFFITLVVFALVLLMMAIGVLLGRRSIQGSCGGADGCDLCFFKDSSQCPHKDSCEGEACLSPSADEIAD